MNGTAPDLLTPAAFLTAAMVATLVALYGWRIRRRNRRLVRPPILGADGKPIPETTITLSDGEKVDCLAVGSVGSEVGDRPVIVLLPGADGMKETFRYQIPAFAREYVVVCASLRIRVPRGATLDRLVDDVVEVLDATEEPGPIVLMGQSLGGAIAMRFAVRFPERVAGLVLVNTLSRVSYDHVGLNRALLAPLAMATTRYLPTVPARWLARLWSRLEVWIYDASPGRERVVDYALWTGPRTVPSSVSRARVRLLKRADLRPQLPSIRAPTLVMKGPRDHYVPPAAAHEIASLVPGAIYAEVAGTGHCSHLSMPASFNARVLAWLHGPAPRTASYPAAGVRT